MKMTYLYFSLFVITLLLTACSNQQLTIATQNDNNIDNAVKKISTQISETLIKQQKSKVAVMVFTTTEKKITKLGIYLADKLTNSLFPYQHKFEVVDRMHLEKVLSEMKLGMTGLQDPNSIQQLGKMIGADAIVTGSLTILSSKVDINTRLIGTERSNVLAIANAIMVKDKDIESLLRVVSIKGETIGSGDNKNFENITSLAKITASSIYSAGYNARNIADGIKGIHARGEWASRGERTGAWVLLEWQVEKELTKIILYDRPGHLDHVINATIMFSDGTKLKTGILSNDGTPKDITFKSKVVKWIKIVIDSANGPNIGFSEIEVFGR